MNRHGEHHLKKMVTTHNIYKLAFLEKTIESKQDNPLIRGMPNNDIHYTG